MAAAAVMSSNQEPLILIDSDSDDDFQILGSRNTNILTRSRRRARIDLSELSDNEPNNNRGSPAYVIESDSDSEAHELPPLPVDNEPVVFSQPHSPLDWPRRQPAPTASSSSASGRRLQPPPVDMMRSPLPSWLSRSRSRSPALSRSPAGPSPGPPLDFTFGPAYR
eukprot:663427_1